MLEATIFTSFIIRIIRIEFYSGIYKVGYSCKDKQNIKRDKSFADDLIKGRGIVSARVALLLRCTEIKPLFYRFVLRNNVWESEERM